MDTLIYGQDARVRMWAEKKIGVKFGADAVGIGIERDGELIVSVVYDRYSGNDICMHVAAEPGVRWVTKANMKAFFMYPFLQLGCNRVTGLVAADNLKARKFDEHIGFVQEGILRDGVGPGHALIVYGMLRSECRWIDR